MSSIDALFTLKLNAIGFLVRLFFEDRKKKFLTEVTLLFPSQENQKSIDPRSSTQFQIHRFIYLLFNWNLWRPPRPIPKLRKNIRNH